MNDHIWLEGHGAGCDDFMIILTGSSYIYQLLYFTDIFGDMEWGFCKIPSALLCGVFLQNCSYKFSDLFALR